MRSLLRLLPPLRTAPKTAPPLRERIEVALDDGRRIALLQVRDPRAKRVKLSVDERGARLTLPKRASAAEGARFLHQHRQWLAAQLAQQAEAAGSGLQRGVTSALPLRGLQVPLHWQTGRIARLAFDEHGALCFSAPGNAGPAALQRVLRDFYEAQGRADVGRWLPAYLPGLPRPPRRIVFKRTASLWGSLAPDGSLALDLALLLAPPPAFEYVLVHELCHLLHADHSAAFWRAVAARCPDWRTQRDDLRRDGRALKGRLRQLLTAPAPPV